MKEFTTGAVAKMLGVSRDVIGSYGRSGAPLPSRRLGRWRVYRRGDIMRLHDYLEAKGIAVTRPDFAKPADTVHSTA